MFTLKIVRQCRSSDFRYILSNLGNYCNLSEVACLSLTSLRCNGSQSTEEKDASLPSSSISLVKSGSSVRKIRCPFREIQKICVNRLHESTICAAMRAERTFRLQVVFDPKTRKRLRLSEPTMEDVNEERLAHANADLPDGELFLYAGE